MSPFPVALTLPFMEGNYEENISVLNGMVTREPAVIFGCLLERYIIIKRIKFFTGGGFLNF
jgi:hypothetical protein